MVMGSMIGAKKKRAILEGLELELLYSTIESDGATNPTIWRDTSGQDNHALLYNTSLKEGGVHFNGTDAYALIHNNIVLNKNVAIEFYCKGVWAVSKRDRSSGIGGEMVFYEGYVRKGYNHYWNQWGFDGFVSYLYWNHVVINVHDGFCELWINGVKSTIRAGYSSRLDYELTYDEPIRLQDIYHRDYAGYNFRENIIKAFRIYNRTLTEEEIGYNYNSFL